MIANNPKAPAWDAANPKASPAELVGCDVAQLRAQRGGRDMVEQAGRVGRQRCHRFLQDGYFREQVALRLKSGR